MLTSMSSEYASGMGAKSVHAHMAAHSLARPATVLFDIIAAVIRQVAETRIFEYAATSFENASMPETIFRPAFEWLNRCNIFMQPELRFE